MILRIVDAMSGDSARRVLQIGRGSVQIYWQVRSKHTAAKGGERDKLQPTKVQQDAAGPYNYDEVAQHSLVCWLRLGYRICLGSPIANVTNTQQLYDYGLVATFAVNFACIVRVKVSRKSRLQAVPSFSSFCSDMLRKHDTK